MQRLLLEAKERKNVGGMSSAEARVLEFITSQRGEYLALLQKLVSFDSRIEGAGRTGKEGPIQEFIARKLYAVGADTVDSFEPNNDMIRHLPGYNPNHKYEGRPNVVGTFKGTGDANGRSLLLNGHADVVAPGRIDAWTMDPFSGQIAGGKIYGRGTTDMKGGLAAGLAAIEAIKRCGLQLTADVLFESVVDEEGGGNGTLACVAKGYRADAALIMEPTHLEVHAANRGAFLGEFTVTGRPVHASLKGVGVNAIEKAIKLIEALGELERHWLLTKRHPLLANPTINIGQIMGGDGASVVAGECTVRFDVEFLPRDYADDGTEFVVDKNAVKREVEAWLADACEGDPWLRANPVTVNWYQETSAFQTAVDHPLVQTAVAASNSVLGRAKVSGFPAGCDGVHLAEVGKMPVVILGPGKVEQAHTVDEFLDVNEYLDAIKILAITIMRWVGVREE